ncbi:formyltransferase family protein [Gammaproteobacteria bacterium]|nr:formyltransferase family protein [Gammaproteobacteria bacterium]
MKNIVVITSNAIRHNYFKILLAKTTGINVLRTYAETEGEFSLKEEEPNKKDLKNKAEQHLIARHNTEYDFFSDVIKYCKDESNTKFIEKGEINDSYIVDEILELDPDLIVAYGCSIIHPPLIKHFKDRIINIHLGLSPYYFGSGTNFHCLVNNEFQFEGYTFMYMDEGIDTGRIIHQGRAKILPFDNPHQIGNRLIKKMTQDIISLILDFDLVEDKHPASDFTGKTYKIKDATDELILALYDNFENGAVLEYLLNKDNLLENFPLVKQSFLNNSYD